MPVHELHREVVHRVDAAEVKDRNFDSRPQGGEASEGSRKGRGAAPPPGRRLTDRRGAVCGRHSSTVRWISARRAIAETCLRPAACAGALASAPALEGIRVKREPRRLRGQTSGSISYTLLMSWAHPRRRAANEGDAESRGGRASSPGPDASGSVC